MKNSVWINIISIIIAVSLSVGGAFTVLKNSDILNYEKIINIERQINCIDKMERNVALNTQKIEYFESFFSSEIVHVKVTLGELQKISNILSAEVDKNSLSNDKILDVLEKLNYSIGGLNIVIARLDERLKSVEKNGSKS